MLRDRSQKYQRSVSRDQRTAFVLLLDLSGSMMDIIEYRGRKMTKCECVGLIAEQILQELYLRACRNGECRNYYDVAVLSYSGRGVLTHLGSSDAPLQPISEIEGQLGSITVSGINRLDTPEDIAERLEEGGVVVEPRGESPMYEALLWVHELMEGWCSLSQNMDSYPPTIIHITDGQATDASLEGIVDMAKNIISLGTNDGDVLMFNMQLSDQSHGESLIFPTDSELEEHPNEYLRGLGRASSLLPKRFEPLVNEMRGVQTAQPCRGVGYNASVAEVISMMAIGTDIEL